jgi:hypothetical protein
MRDLNFEAKKLCERNKDGSHSTQANRQKILNLVADQIHGLGFRNLKLGNIKPKHIEALINHWKLEGLSSGTIKNRMSCLRWLAEKINKPSLMTKDNSSYGIEKRIYVTNKSKAKQLESEKFDDITDPYTKVSLKLQQAFGLRREESIKFIPSYADMGDRIRLKSSWTKGGLYREVLIRNNYQRQVLDEAHALAGNGSLIPKSMNYVEQMRRFDYQTNKVGIDHVHGLRHAYAQLRYEEITGWKSPAAGGKTSRELTKAEKAIDLQARLTISAELGHKREGITAIYLGR